MAQRETGQTGRYIKVGLLGLLAVVGFDLFLHAGVLSPLYAARTPFLLDPQAAFRRIPLGYASFVLLLVLLEWLMVRLSIRDARAGAVFGLKLGALLWGALALGLASIATARPALLVGWAIGQALELGLAGAVVGAGLAARTLRGLAWRTLILFVGLAVLGMVLQNLLV